MKWAADDDDEKSPVFNCRRLTSIPIDDVIDTRRQTQLEVGDTYTITTTVTSHRSIEIKVTYRQQAL